MKNNLFMPEAGIICFLLINSINLSGQVIHRSSYDLANLERNVVTNGDVNYEKIIMKSSSSSEDIGKPDLPVFYYCFYIPKDQHIAEVKWECTDTREVQLNFDLLPVQLPVPLSEKAESIPFSLPDMTVYGADAFYPECRVKVCHTDYFDGDLQIVTVEAYPVQYQPLQKLLRFSSQMEIRLTTSQGIEVVPGQVIFPMSHDSLSTALLKSLVQNPGDVPTVILSDESGKATSICFTGRRFFGSADTLWMREY